MQAITTALLTMGLGALIAIYMPMNATLSKHMGSAISANVIFYLIGTVMTLVIFFVTTPVSNLSTVTTAPRYLLLAGIISAFMVLGMIYLLPIMGARRVFVLLVAGQILCALIIGHFAWLGTPSDPITLKKVLGAALVLAGVAVSIS